MRFLDVRVLRLMKSIGISLGDSFPARTKRRRSLNEAFEIRKPLKTRLRNKTPRHTQL
jgi:hypothetical protein